MALRTIAFLFLFLGIASPAAALPLLGPLGAPHGPIAEVRTAKSVIDTKEQSKILYQIRYHPVGRCALNCAYTADFDLDFVHWKVSGTLRHEWVTINGDNMYFDDIVYTHKVAPHGEPPMSVQMTMPFRWAGKGAGFTIIEERAQHIGAPHPEENIFRMGGFFSTNAAGTVFNTITLVFTAAHPPADPPPIPLPAGLALLLSALGLLGLRRLF